MTQTATDNEQLLDETEIDGVLQALAPIREIYEPELLQALAKKLPRHVAIQNQALLLEWNKDDSCIVGMTEPDNAINLRNIVRALDLPSQKVYPRLLSPQRLAMLHEVAYEERDDSIARPEEELHERPRKDTTQPTIDWRTFDTTHFAATPQHDAPNTDPQIEIGLGTGLRALAEKIIIEAIKRRASDIHVMPGLPVGKICTRTDGSVSPLIENIPPDRMNNLANAFSDMAGVNSYELQQVGKGAEINILVATSDGHKERMTLRFQGTRGYYGIAIVIRIQRAVFRGFDHIGLEPSQQLLLHRALEYQHGVILITGPTGSGKSNTLEAMLRAYEQNHNYTTHTIQVGNPIEFPNKDRTQLPLNDEDAWGESLKHALRMDPDCFSPGEFRDAHQAGIVFQAAATGHLTLTTLHTNDVAQTFSRLDFMNIGRDKQGDLIRLIGSQILAPVLCRHCRKPDPRTREIAGRLIDVVFPNRPDLKKAISTAEGGNPFYHAEGCPACHNSGKKGRTCVAELLLITPDIGRMLRKNIEGEEIVDYAVRNHGMMTLAEAAARKLCRGQISYDSIKHLLIATHQAAPTTETYQWQTSTNATAEAPNNDPTYAATSEQTDDDSDAIVGEVVDLEFTRPVTDANTSNAQAYGAQS
jgi:type II secretory ATPase GspE/PulE/Tfp pilus assembly ATPase PilB-like protein